MEIKTSAPTPTAISFWGKLERSADGVVTQWHPLAAHCADVAACAEALLRKTILRRRLAVLGGREDLTEQDTQRLCVLAALHDIGKFNLGFWRKAGLASGMVAGHVREVIALLGVDFQASHALKDALDWPTLSRWGDDPELILELLVASIGHHGRPVSLQNPGVRVDRTLWASAGQLDPFVGIEDLARQTRSWFPGAYIDADGTLPSSPAFQHAFAGLVMLADWLGSDRRFFPFAPTLDDRMSFARAASARALEAIGVDVAAARACLGPEAPGFERISPFLPRPAQEAVLSLDDPEPGGLVVLESETGSGKTEAALARFARLFQKGLVDGMVFCLPTRTAATQIHRRVVEAMMRAFPDPESRPAVVLAVPGYLMFDETSGQMLADFEVLWNEERDARRFRGWAAEQPKRYLAGTIVVGTIDQVLLSSLRVSHAHLRATALLRQLLVVDEVHASDIYMTRILEEVLAFHVAAGGHAFLMSATLGSQTRERLEQTAGNAASGASEEGGFERALATPYPVVHQTPRGGVSQALPVASGDASKHIKIELQAIADEPASVARIAVAAAREGARVLVLRNTVTDAVATQLALEALIEPADAELLFRVGDVLTLHTARFTRDDRRLLDQSIEDRFGKHAKSASGVIAIATQTVQQSLDLDADIMLTDLAPMDVLLQRFGRVHRHSERNPVRPARFRCPRAVVLVSDQGLGDSLLASGEARGRHGVGTVYDNLLILEATYRELAKAGELAIPQQNRALVERTTHLEPLNALADSLGGLWEQHLVHIYGKGAADRGLASLNVVARDAKFGEYQFGTEGLRERIAARLGESDRLAQFESPVQGPFGQPLRELTLPGWLVRDAQDDPERRPTEVLLREGATGPAIAFSFGPKRFLYDRLGLRLDDTEQSETTSDCCDA